MILLTKDTKKKLIFENFITKCLIFGSAFIAYGRQKSQCCLPYAANQSTVLVHK